MTATDGFGNATSRSFVVEVVDTTAPSLSVPTDITAEATSAAGAMVAFAATATDAVSTPTISYSQAPGTTFALGTTTVVVTATDGAHNTTTKSFTVTVVDTTPPVLTVPSDVTAEATNASGAAVDFAAERRHGRGGRRGRRDRHK